MVLGFFVLAMHVFSTDISSALMRRKVNLLSSGISIQQAYISRFTLVHYKMYYALETTSVLSTFVGAISESSPTEPSTVECVRYCGSK